MSDVISFRLDKANPREAQALEVLNAWIEKGFSTRFVLTKALRELGHHGSDLEMSQADRDLDVVLNQIGHVLEIVKSIKDNRITGEGRDPEKSNLNANFLASIKQGIKPGIKSG